MSFLRICVLFLILSDSVLAQEPVASEPIAHGMDNGAATRTAAKYQDLEQQLLDAQIKQDRATLTRMLSEDFGATSAESVDGRDRDTWLEDSAAQHLQSAQSREFSVRELGDHVVVSFIQDQTGAQRNDALAPALFIVDVWDQRNDTLLARFTSVPTHPIPPDTRPSGRE